MENAVKEKTYYYHIDLLRVILAVIVVFYHILRSNIIPYVSNPIYETIGYNMQLSGGAIVQFFFLFSGFFMYLSFQRNSQKSVFQYTCDRFVRLWPVFIFAFIAESVTYNNLDWQYILVNGALLQCTGISFDNTGILWYVSPLFFVSIFYYAILKNFSYKHSSFIISIISFFAFAFMINYNGGSLNGRQTVFYVINLGLTRGVAFVGLGILLCMFHSNLCHIMQDIEFSKSVNNVFFICKTVVEVLAIIFFYKYFFENMVLRNDIIYVIIFSLFFLSIISNKSPFSIVFNHSFFASWGKYTYSIYVMQQTCFNILKKTLWNISTFIDRPWLVLSISTVFCILIGILVYYLVEKPCVKLYHKLCDMPRKVSTPNAES